ncbi:aldose 1-epimerase family protein [Flavobacterium wongokense]|uniref:aldose 1-epimerase family protein n=1 Tax=Flavobacterium wongokense TaxID=2910674 RepID=UPI001F4426C1|nr:aldose 1-epimerase family protein [Flavobacterium sp. WG47]MCF6132097.1 aldose 1-epimerase family protein [Flavobacterium sp. WG47]
MNETLKTTLSNSTLSATISHNGAELTSLYSIVNKREYIWEGNPDYWGKHSPILFPIVGTLKNNSFAYDGKAYTLSRHGFARDMVFDLILATKTEAVFSLKSNIKTKELYPFDFELQLSYALKDSELVITYKVINKNPKTMYYSIGGHPAFALPESFENYSLQFEQDEKLISYQLENDLLSDRRTAIRLDENQLPLTYSLFEKDALIFKELKSKQIQILENGSSLLNFRFDDFPNFGIWTKANAPFICLEPWAGYSDVVNASGNIAEKEAIQNLAANTEKEYRFSIQIL